MERWSNGGCLVVSKLQIPRTRLQTNSNHKIPKSLRRGWVLLAIEI